MKRRENKYRRKTLKSGKRKKIKNLGRQHGSLVAHTDWRSSRSAVQVLGGDDIYVKVELGYCKDILKL